jgi:Domain of unknown function (DUF6968)
MAPLSHFPGMWGLDGNERTSLSSVDVPALRTEGKMSNVILSRLMELDNNQTIKIEIDQPQRQKADEYTCAFRILSNAQSPASQTVTGGDEISVVMIAFDAIRHVLLEQFPTATLLGLPIEIAFPRAIPNVAGFDTYKEIEALADKHLEDKFGNRPPPTTGYG